jgi:hypothetical protein
MQTYIRTHSGRHFDYTRPKAADIFIGDIAHALSQLCRFAGQSPVFYSVAQHSVYTSQLCEDDHPYEPALILGALLHDATEAYMNDVPLPLKNLLPEYTKMEDRICRIIFKAFDIPQITYASVKKYDKQALIGEFVSIIKTGFGGKSDVEWPIAFPTTAWSPEVAKANFLARFVELTDRIRVKNDAETKTA